MYGYWGKFLRVNLTTKDVSIEEFDEDFARKWLGGVGFGIRKCYEEIPAGADPLGSSNLLVISAGPFSGYTGIQGSSRFSISFKSPLTGFWGQSTGGGDVAEELKRTGFDAVIIKGASNEPIWLYIHNGGAEIKDASELWGMDIFEAEEQLRKETVKEKVQDMTIGQAGENLVRYAGVLTEGGHGVAARMGVGTVFGSKKLKAIIFKGTSKFSFARPEKVKEKNKELAERVKKSDYAQSNRANGQAMAVIPREESGVLPIKNFSMGTWKDGVKKIGAAGGEYNKILDPRPKPCAFCSVACHRRVTVDKKSKYDMDGYGPEYETLAMVGSNCLVDNLEALNYANHLLNRYGLDSIDFGAICAMMMEAYEKGLIDKKDVGFELRWGDANAIIKLIDLIVFRKNELGRLLGEGLKTASEELGFPEFAVQKSNAAIPAHDPRAYFSMAVSYATGPRGPCHITGFSEGSELGVPVEEYGLSSLDRFSTGQKGLAVIAWQDIAMVDNSLTLCHFFDFQGFSHQDKADLLNALTGWNITSRELLKEIGGRINHLIRMFNLKHGLIPEKEDTLPDRILEPLEEGGASGKVPPVEEMLEEYYEERGWPNGIPTKETLQKFGLAFAVSDLAEISASMKN